MGVCVWVGGREGALTAVWAIARPVRIHAKQPEEIIFCLLGFGAHLFKSFSLRAFVVADALLCRSTLRFDVRCQSR